MSAVDLYSTVRLTRMVDGKGIVGQEYLVIDNSDSVVVVLFPGHPSGHGVHDGWTLGAERTERVRGIGLDPGTLSGWTLYDDSFEPGTMPADPGQWFRNTFMDGVVTEEVVEAPSSGLDSVVYNNASWCNGTVPVGTRHILVAAPGSIFALCGSGSAPDAAQSDAMRRLGLDPNHPVHARGYDTSDRRHLTVDEERTLTASLGSARLDPYTMQCGSVVGDDVQWALLLGNIAVYHQHRAPVGALEIGQHTSLYDALRQRGLNWEDYRYVEDVTVRWRLPEVDWSLVADTALGDDPKSVMRRALVEADAERERYVEVLTAGAKRLGILGDLPKFIDEMDLGPLREFTVDSPLSGHQDLFLRTTIKAPSRQSALRMAPTTAGRGEFTVFSRRAVAVNGAPRITN